jgi:hypothetical protein
MDPTRTAWHAAASDRRHVHMTAIAYFIKGNAPEWRLGRDPSHWG